MEDPWRTVSNSKRQQVVTNLSSDGSVSATADLPVERFSMRTRNNKMGQGAFGYPPPPDYPTTGKFGSVYPVDLGRPNENVGSNFYLFRDSYTRSTAVQFGPDRWRNRLTGTWTGGTLAVRELAPSITTGDWNNQGIIGEIRDMAPSLIADAIPTRAEVDVATAAIELLREGLPTLIGIQTWRDRALRAKNAGSEYLNVEFGWKPLLSDIRDTYRTLNNVTGVLNQYSRDAGKSVRRRRSRIIQSDIQELSGSQMTTLVPSGLWQAASNKRVFKETTDRVVFTGAFRYYISENTLERFAQYGQRLFGLAITPEVLWNLSPWSWLLDWVSNIGDVLTNISYLGSDSLVMTYGYVTLKRETRYLGSFTTKGATLGKSLGGPKPYEGILRTVSADRVVYNHIRLRGNPYHFSGSWEDFTPRQWAILAALGITRK